MDTKPPVAKSADPPNYSTNFSVQKIHIEFDELIELDNPTQEIVITPTPDVMPAFTARKKTLTIDLKGQQLRPNTTYTIHLGNSVVDYHEHNKLGGHDYVFSTGSYLDSFRLEGHMQDAFARAGIQDLKVMLHEDTSFTAVKRKKPIYYARSVSDGGYKLDHLKQGTYRLVALEDKNNNHLWDPDERAGFASQLIRLDSVDNKAPNVLLSLPYSDTLFVKTITNDYPVLTFSFNRPMRGVKVSQKTSGTDQKGEQYSPLRLLQLGGGDSFQVWPAVSEQPTGTASALLRIQAQGFSKDTVLRIPNAKIAAVGLALSVSASADNFNQYGTPVIIESNFPLKNIDSQRVKLKWSDSGHTPITKIRLQRLDEGGVKYGIFPKQPWPEGGQLQVALVPGVATDIFGHVRKDSVTAMITLPTREEFGSITITPSVADTTYPAIFQLLASDDKIVIERPANGKQIRLPYLPSGSYRLRMIQDRNRNGLWDPADLERGLQPEKVIYAADPIEIKANWEIENVDWMGTF